ncbi:hypothetical protein VCCP104821_1286 [Vibrio cholerae CP1048(21)]|nr:hypothetical protein VCHC61A1_2167 [Vibrio cholerae HC-61A1]EJH47698.1 hypothetical protein VCCP104821_1286 [Vibrio cholerae CP1048(21)]ELT25707.1 hypothetical protein VCHC7A1_02372 [Vibrio cholerae HC-7A1]CSA48718.1 Uncharacterised protein [Vibrio cholerae]CSI19323.1 Uncharacterised protein [Vibrio cholerae]
MKLQRQIVWVEFTSLFSTQTVIDLIDLLIKSKTIGWARWVKRVWLLADT